MQASIAARTRSLCICIDDFGLDAAINEAALRLVRAGLAHAVSCQVGAPAWTGAWIDALRGLPRAKVDIGLHLDFTEYPVRTASRRSLAGLMAASLLRRLEPAAVRAEIRAQLDAFENALGRAPDFVDGHQHVQQLPVIRTELIAELADRYGRASLWVRSSGARYTWAMWRAVGTAGALKAYAIALLGAGALSRLAREAGLAHNTRLLGIYDARANRARCRALLTMWLQAADSGDLLMCHPAVAQGADSITARVVEFEALAGLNTARLLGDLGVRLAPLSRTLGAAASPDGATAA